MRLLLALLLSSSMAMAVTVSNTHRDTGTGTAVSSTTFTATAGHMIFVICATGSGGFTLNAPTDSGGNTYTSNQGTTSNGGTKLHTWYSTNITGFVGGSVTCNTSSSVFQVVAYFEMSGPTAADVTSTADKSYTATASPWASNTLTTVNASDVLISYVVNDAVSHTYTVPVGFTGISLNTDISVAYQVVSSTVSQTYSWTGTGAADNMIVGMSSFRIPSTANPSHRPLNF